MSFLDRATIEVSAGSGGDGLISFHRAKYVPRGGPDGGNGGDGGSLILKAAKNLNSLDRIAQKRFYSAEDGVPGKKRNCHGRNGESLTVHVPLGTIIRDSNGEFIADFTDIDQEYVLCKGGLGGKGNVHFVHATRQVPRIATRGQIGESGKYQLELKLIAQIGLVGLPNAGKSTFLRSTTRATPEVGAYPFTTLTPKLGIVEFSESRELVIADIPGLIEGASKGIGLGDEFLKHVERTEVLLHLVEVTGGEEYGTPTPLEAYETICNELISYDANFAKKKTIIALNKCDAVSVEEAKRVKRLLEEKSGSKVSRISGVAKKGLKPLLFALAEALDELAEEEKSSSES
ncbi:MAG: GTPase ObgE [Planctomycetota bacterium]|nr:GTPase ObgE [Planctomycetota bacterium]